jgi:hypothetical protein
MGQDFSKEYTLKFSKSSKTSLLAIHSQGLGIATPPPFSLTMGSGGGGGGNLPTTVFFITALTQKKGKNKKQKKC